MWNRKARELVEQGTIGEASDETERWRNGKKVEEEAERQTRNIQPDSTINQQLVMANHLVSMLATHSSFRICG